MFESSLAEFVAFAGELADSIAQCRLRGEKFKAMEAGVLDDGGMSGKTNYLNIS